MMYQKIKMNLGIEKESNHDVLEQKVNNRLFQGDLKRVLEDNNNLKYSNNTIIFKYPNNIIMTKFS